MLRTTLLLAVLLAGCETISREQMQEMNYGPRPTAWQKTVLDYLNPRMPDAKTAQITMQTQPKAYVQRETMLRDRQWGWVVCVYVDENHPKGAEDPYAVTFFFRGEKMTNVNGGPGDRNPIGAGFARSQCKDLGAPSLPAPKFRREEEPSPKQPASPFPK